MGATQAYGPSGFQFILGRETNIVGKVPGRANRYGVSKARQLQNVSGQKPLIHSYLLAK